MLTVLARAVSGEHFLVPIFSRWCPRVAEGPLDFLGFLHEGTNSAEGLLLHGMIVHPHTPTLACWISGLEEDTCIHPVHSYNSRPFYLYSF